MPLKSVGGGAGSSGRGGGKPPDPIAARFVWHSKAEGKTFNIRQLSEKLKELNFKLKDLALMAISFEVTKFDKYPEAAKICEGLTALKDGPAPVGRKLYDLMQIDMAEFVRHFGDIKLCAKDLFASAEIVLQVFMLNNVSYLFPNASAEEIFYGDEKAIPAKFLGKNWQTVLRTWLLNI
jgi:hypothetical protein